MDTFTTLGVRPRTLETLNKLGITTPTQVQIEAIPALKAKSDCVISAPTGSGKTLAFLIPLIEHLQGPRSGSGRALIITPTRELATQIGKVLRGLDPKLHFALVFGGASYGPQINALRTADVIIGCPGRLVDMCERGSARLQNVEYLVLDEADEMLDAGFAYDVEKLIARCKLNTRQTVLASATMPTWVQTMVKRHLKNPVNITVTTDNDSVLEHGLLSVERTQKVNILHELLKQQINPTIVFHRTKHGAKKLTVDLIRLGHRTAELQGNLSQGQRDRAINSFHSGSTKVLVATNIAARGLDVKNVGLVVNFELPESAQWLTHRVGRTARNGANGQAITFLSTDNAEQWRKLRRSGAPDLQMVDKDKLLETGELHFTDQQVITVRQNTRPHSDRSRDRFRYRSRNNRR